MKTGSDKFRIHEGSYQLQILQKVADGTKYSNCKSEEISASWMQREIKFYWVGNWNCKMSENSIKSGNDLLLHPVFPTPVTWGYTWNSPFKAVLLLGDSEIAPVFFSSSSVRNLQSPLQWMLRGLTVGFSNSWVTWLLGGHIWFHVKWQNTGVGFLVCGMLPF